jgi:hypothetical protein
VLCGLFGNVTRKERETDEADTYIIKKIIYKEKKVTITARRIFLKRQISKKYMSNPGGPSPLQINGGVG